MAPLDPKVHDLVVALERDVLDAVARAMGWVAALLLALAVFEHARGHGSVWLAIEAATTLAMAFGLRRRVRHRARSLVLTAGLTTVAICALLHYGPLLGTGLLFVAAVLCATFFFASRGAIAILVTLAAALGATAAGLGPPMQPPLELMAWLRIGVGSMIVLGYLSYLLYKLQQVNHRLLDREVRALREQEQHAFEREQMLRAAQATERLASLGRMASGVAHDFNNALQVIQMGVTMVRSKNPEPTSAALLHEVEVATRDAAKTVRELLTFARQAPKPEGRCAPGALVERLGVSLRRLLPERVVLELDGSYEGQVAVAEDELEQVLLSLVFNARDAIPEGGTVRVAVGDTDAGAFQLSVTDDGQGMDEETRRRIFEPFFTTRGAHGTGLGLATVWGIVTRAAGSIEVASELGHGSTFTVRLPSAGPQSEAPVAAS